MRKWKRVETGDGPLFRSALEPHEAVLLRNLAGSVVGMLDDREASSPMDELAQITGMRTGNTQRPADAALQRLLPDFHRPDDRRPGDAVAVDSLNAALRSLHEPQIIDAKRDAARLLLNTVPERGGRFELTEDQAAAWIAAVNDIRLALGVILDIGPSGPGRLPADDAAADRLGVYHWLTVLQEYLVLALMGRPA